MPPLSSFLRETLSRLRGEKNKNTPINYYMTNIIRLHLPVVKIIHVRVLRQSRPTFPHLLVKFVQGRLNELPSLGGSLSTSTNFRHIVETALCVSLHIFTAKKCAVSALLSSTFEVDRSYDVHVISTFPLLRAHGGQ